MQSTSCKSLVYLILFLLFACSPSRKTASGPASAKGASVNTPVQPATAAARPGFLEEVLRQYPQYFTAVLNRKDSLQAQIIYTRIDRQADNTPVFTDYYYHVNERQYFYPASTVKMPVALLALQRLRELNKPGLDKNTTMITGSAFSGQTPVYNDPASPDGRPTIANYVKKVFLVSDNDAFNRLYEFAGPEYINTQLRKMGYGQTEIIHRLNIVLTEEENRHTNPVQFLDAAGKVVYEQEAQQSTLKPLQRRNRLGKGYLKNDTLVEKSFDFSRKNRLTLPGLHNILKSVLFPAAVPQQQRFNLSADDYKFVWKYMSQYPAETTSPAYDAVRYPDGYVKFLYWGAERKPLPKQLRSFNKVGDAYGFLVDVAYVVDFEKKIEFMLSAVVYCNSDGILNDDRYDYQSTGLPFMKHLGQVIYDYELKRPRTQVPDLSAFKLVYDKK